MKTKSYTTLLRSWVGISRYRNTPWPRLLKMYMKFVGNTRNPEFRGGGGDICSKCLYDYVILLEITWEIRDAGYTLQVHHYSRDRFVLAAQSFAQLAKIPFLIVFCLFKHRYQPDQQAPRVVRHGWSLNIESVCRPLKYFWLVFGHGFCYIVNMFYKPSTTVTFSKYT